MNESEKVQQARRLAAQRAREYLQKEQQKPGYHRHRHRKRRTKSKLVLSKSPQTVLNSTSKITLDRSDGDIVATGSVHTRSDITNIKFCSRAVSPISSNIVQTILCAHNSPTSRIEPDLRCQCSFVELSHDYPSISIDPHIIER